MPDLSEYSAAQRSAWNAINRVAEAEFVMVHLLRSALRQKEITEAGKPFSLPGCTTMLDWFEKNFSIVFMRMGTFIRLACELESFLRFYYMEKRGISRRSAVASDVSSFDPGFGGAVFQRVSPMSENSLMDLYKAALDIDLLSFKHFVAVQEVFVHRHLFVHQNGLVDSRYLDQIGAILGADERTRVEQAVLAEAEVQDINDAEVFWFEPINKRFSTLIEAAKTFVLELPT